MADRPKVGDILVECIKIQNYNNTEKADIKQIATEFNIYEDINSPYIRADIVVADSLSLVTRLPIIGEELVRINFVTPSVLENQSGQYKHFDMIFQVVGVDKLQISEQDRHVSYILRLVSRERIADLVKVVRLALGPAKISDMVKIVANNYLGLDNQNIEIEQTEGDHLFVIPTLSPFETINFLASEAKNPQSSISNYLFFQTHEKYRFVTAETLLKKNIKESYTFTPKDFVGDLGGTQYSSNRNPTDYRSALALTIDHTFDLETNLSGGMYDNKVYTVDPMLKQFDTVKVREEDYALYYNIYGEYTPTSTGKGDEHPLITDQSPWKELVGESHIRYLITNENQMQYNQEFKNYPRMRPTILPWLVSFYGQFKTHVIKLVIPGDSERMPGDMIFLDVPEFGATDDIRNRLNKYIRGAYFVTAVRHKFTKGAATQYVTLMTCIKNCYSEPIANAPGGFGSDGNTYDSPRIGPEPIPTNNNTGTAGV